ncbi:hypothetical protein SAMN04489842_3350 [Natronobacterium texcoconense]|uniref:Uncharacterized protein n=2 Tax=Natronobacterium texcoconense TaxID=1095778 RepID=A0A1H1IAY0_NATTX|nr:hypothetical protein SAMN04489842_3350 [Natronobacterium texcoconense]
MAMAFFAAFGAIIFVHGVVTGEVYRILMGCIFGMLAAGVVLSSAFERWATDHALVILAVMILVFLTSLQWQGP